VYHRILRRRAMCGQWRKSFSLMHFWLPRPYALPRLVVADILHVFPKLRFGTRDAEVPTTSSMCFGIWGPVASGDSKERPRAHVLAR
jgi:hypothetical protein